MMSFSSPQSRQRVTGSQPERICNNAILTALDHVHLLSLSLNGHILVDDADTAFPGNRNGHSGLGHRIHGRGRSLEKKERFDAFLTLDKLS